MLDIDYRTILDDRLTELLQSSEPVVSKAAIYATIAPSKRIRPLMTLSIANADAIDVACAIEMIHTYSLIHDDLPAMDDDDMRRGQPSLHIKTDEATAILTGDFLLTLAFEILSDTPEILKMMAQKIGANGIIGGQIQDLASKLTQISFEQYETIALKKTGALFAAACKSGAMFANLSKEEITTYESFGEIFGIIFQIKDDLSDKVELSSIQAIIGEKKANEILNALIVEANVMLDSLSSPPSYLKQLLK